MKEIAETELYIVIVNPPTIFRVIGPCTKADAEKLKCEVEKIFDNVSIKRLIPYDEFLGWCKKRNETKEETNS